MLVVREATLGFLVGYTEVGQRQLLLGTHTRGPFEGLVSAPGGKREGGESLFECLRRECLAEVGYLPIRGANFRWAGTLESKHGDETWLVYVFYAEEFQGKHTVTAELPSRWYQLDALPFEEMVPADRLWVPKLLRGERFRATLYGENPRERRAVAFFEPIPEPPHLW